MKKKTRGKRTLTFVVIPEASQKTREFKVPKIFLYAIPFLIAGLIVLTYMEYHLHQATSRYNNELQQQLAAKEAEMQAALTEKEAEMRTAILSKDQTIKTLHEDIKKDMKAVSEQAKEVQDKVNDLKELEEELRGMAGNQDKTPPSAAAGKSSPVTISSSPSLSVVPVMTSRTLGPLAINDDEDGDVIGMGGQSYPSSDEEIEQWASFTGESFAAWSEELDRLKLDLANSKDNILAYRHLREITPSIWPTSARLISSPFGSRVDPINGSWSYHSGMDIAGKSGTPIVATASGTVIEAGYSSSEGYHVLINHTNGIKTHYMHMSKLLVKSGQKVKKGEQIGLMGSTGRSTGPHVHYEVIVNGKSVNPVPYLKPKTEG